jgi:ribosome maturation factor RimP
MTARLDLNERQELEARIRDLSDQLAGSMALEVVLVEIKGGGGSPIVRTYIDKPGGVTLEDCERFSKRLSVLLDVEDWIPCGYTLEVSSPGIDRPLVKEADFERFAGKGVRVRARSAIAGQRNFQGKILGVVQGKVGIELGPGRRIDIAIGEIERANLMMVL